MFGFLCFLSEGKRLCYEVTALPLALLHGWRSDTGGGIGEGHTPSVAKGNPRRCRGGFAAGPEWMGRRYFCDVRRSAFLGFGAEYRWCGFGKMVFLILNSYDFPCISFVF